MANRDDVGWNPGQRWFPNDVIPKNFRYSGSSFRFRRILRSLEMYSGSFGNQLFHVSDVECSARQFADKTDYANVIND